MQPLLLSLLLPLAACYVGAYMTSDMTPDPGPVMSTVYQPGSPGAAWSPEEVETTRQRVLQMIHPDWSVKMSMGVADQKLGRNQDGGPGEVTENVLMRLVFHDCIPYADGTGGCDGCLNWGGMDSETPNPNDETHKYKFDPINATDNKGLDGAAKFLEVIYTTLDWPLVTPSLTASLHQSGKSRADLWQLAGLVALEQALERANRACDLDFHGRQQVTLLEGRDKCEIKLTKPLKFLTGRKDCVPDQAEAPAYVTTKAENQPKLFGDAKHIIDYGKNMFGMDAEHFTALQGIHGAVHAARIGLKYTWFGPGYISNMYFKMIANKPMYQFRKGGDLSFTSCTKNGAEITPIFDFAVGDKEGKPVASTGWRASCMYLWNTTEGGPCVMRPIPDTSFDAPNPDKMTYFKCVDQTARNGECKIVTDGFMGKKCKDTVCNENNVLVGSMRAPQGKERTGPWTEADQQRHTQGFNNQFALPYETGLFWNLTTGGVGQRAIGCPGLDEPFGEVKTEGDEKGTGGLWPFRNNNSPIWGSPAMQCDVNTYAPEGRPMHEIVDELASDNEVFAEKFLASWQQMTSNGYSPADLADGPHNGWVGHYSLTQQGVDIPDFETYIEENAPVVFTDPTADPWICGHRGHAATTCGIRFSKYFELGSQPGSDGCSFEKCASGSDCEA